MTRRHRISLSLANNLFKASYNSQAKSFVAAKAVGKHTLRQQGSHLGFCHFVSRSQGKRLRKDGGQLGRKDRLQSVWQQTLLWMEEANLHILSSQDVLSDFLNRLEEAIAVREKDQEAGALTAEGRLELAAMQQKLVSMRSRETLVTDIGFASQARECTAPDTAPKDILKAARAMYQQMQKQNPSREHSPESHEAGWLVPLATQSHAQVAQAAQPASMDQELAVPSQ